MLSLGMASTLTPARDTINPMGIGQRIKLARRAARMTQAQLARAVGVTRSAVSQMETGLTNDPRPAHLLKYAKALGMTPEELVHGGAAPRAEEPRSSYSTLAPGEKLLIDFIRSSSHTEADRESMARQALALLLALSARPVADSKLGTAWDATQKKGGK